MHKQTTFSVSQVFDVSKIKNKFKSSLAIFSFLVFSLFAQAAHANHRADFVFIVDATGSMAGEINAVRTGLQSFVQGLDLAQIDAHFALWYKRLEQEKFK